MASSTTTDGNITWSGGMNASIHPADLPANYYSRAVNKIVPDNLGGLAVRHGIHQNKITFSSNYEEEMFRESGKVQGMGWFNDGIENYLLISVNGRIYRGKEITSGHWEMEVINSNDPNLTDVTKCWISRIPSGAIVNDGRSRPLFVTKNSSRRSRKFDGEISPGRAGVYVQNRFWYISQDKKMIYGSSLLNPYSLEEAYLTNIWGFSAPEDIDDITAIGLRKSIYNTSKSGQLIFSTQNNIYSVDVRGARAGWGTSSGTGTVSENINGVGAASSFAFESFNSNIFFRSKGKGLCNLRYSQSDQAYSDISFDQSPEIRVWTDRDADWLLDHCYIGSTGERLLMTVTPGVNKQGFPYWNGMICLVPSYSYGDAGRVSKRFESLWTGVRPVCMTSLPNKLMLISYDEDGINRLYSVEPGTTYDVDSNFNRKEIESWVETRGYNHKQPLIPKAPDRKIYSLRSIPRSIELNFTSRSDSVSNWTCCGKREHLVERCCEDIQGCFVPTSSSAQSRQRVVVSGDPPSDQIGGTNDATYLYRQDRIESKGSFVLDYWMRVSSFASPGDSPTPTEVRASMLEAAPTKDYTYSLSSDAGQ